MQNIVLSPIPIETLKAELTETLIKELQKQFSLIQPQTANAEYLTRKEAAKLLGVSLPTLNEWTKEGRIKGYRIASRVRYKRNELEASLSQIITGKR